MKNILQKVCYSAAGIVGIGILVSAVLAYFVVSFDPVTLQTFDGLGRELEPSPRFIILIFGEVAHGPGGGRWLAG